jgi:hypothetical protein
MHQTMGDHFPAHTGREHELMAKDAANRAHENLIILIGIMPKNLNVKEKSKIVNNNSKQEVVAHNFLAGLFFFEHLDGKSTFLLSSPKDCNGLPTALLSCRFSTDQVFCLLQVLKNGGISIWTYSIVSMETSKIGFSMSSLLVSLINSSKKETQLKEFRCSKMEHHGGKVFG